ncbi:MAG: signal peptide peptidase SppA [Phycisphaerae bacterium]|nr:signal peptide peptidase SppA [Phycisphaerae bacterium]
MFRFVRTRLVASGIAGFVVIVFAGCMPTGSFKITSMPNDQSLKERIVHKDPGWVSDRIAIIDISGLLMNAHQPGLFSEGEHMVSATVEKLDKAANDSRVKAVVLRINSPGGTVTASDILYSEIQAFKQKTGKPVVAFFQDVAASGAYYLACASDEIIAQRSTITGSIGVIMQMMDLSDGLGRLGITADAITSGPHKDSGTPLRKMRKEERELFQTMVDGLYAQFVDVVVAGRPNMDREQVLKAADGRVYLAKQALEVGLVDGIGTLHDALEAAKRRAGIKSAHAIIYHRPLGWAPNIYAQAPEGGPSAGGTTINLLSIQNSLDWTIRPRFLYIWSSQ